MRGRVRTGRGLKRTAGRSGSDPLRPEFTRPIHREELMMSQSTDTTQPLPQVETPTDSDTTLTMPVVTLPVPPAVPTPPPVQPFDAARQYALHAHTVLSRILRTAVLPNPMSFEVHLWTHPTVEVMLDPAAPGSMDAYRKVFGGEFTSEDREPVRDGAPAMRYDRLATVVDGVEVVVKEFTEVRTAEPAAEAEEPSATETPAETPAAA